jgi:hypothetical protein
MAGGRAKCERGTWREREDSWPVISIQPISIVHAFDTCPAPTHHVTQSPTTQPPPTLSTHPPPPLGLEWAKCVGFVESSLCSSPCLCLFSSLPLYLPLTPPLLQQEGDPASLMAQLARDFRALLQAQSLWSSCNSTLLPFLVIYVRGGLQR